MLNITISDEIFKACPGYVAAVLSCTVKNSPSDPRLWEEIAQEEAAIKAHVKIEEINKWAPIKATRDVYKKLGKDPNRYRPSAESLRRRIVRGLSLYQVDTLVDLINLLSIRTGYSIGGFDLDKIQGGQLTLGVGREGELYHGIGRGELNIAGLPVYRDAVGGIGTPPSDEERTKIDLQTTRLLMIINGYSGYDGLEEAIDYAYRLLNQYASVEHADLSIYRKKESE